MKVYKWILCIVLIVVIAACLFLFGNYKADDTSLKQNPDVVTTTEAEITEEPTEFTYTAEEFNSRMLTLISAYRAQNELSAWIEDDTIYAAAGTRALECAQMESKSHKRPDGSEWYTALGIDAEDENYNYSELVGISTQNPEDLLRTWIASEGINGELLSSDYVSCGIGSEAVGNTVYTTLILYKP